MTPGATPSWLVCIVEPLNVTDLPQRSTRTTPSHYHMHLIQPGYYEAQQAVNHEILFTHVTSYLRSALGNSMLPIGAVSHLVIIGKLRGANYIPELWQYGNVKRFQTPE